MVSQNVLDSSGVQNDRTSLTDFMNSDEDDEAVSVNISAKEIIRRRAIAREMI
jgi:hypothetical protein